MRGSSVLMLLGAAATTTGWRWRGSTDTTMSSRSLCVTPPRNSLEVDGGPYSSCNYDLDQRTQRQLLLDLGALFEQLRVLPLQREASPRTNPAEPMASVDSPVDADPPFRWNDLESPENIARFRDEMDRVGYPRHLPLSSGPRHAVSPMAVSNGTVAQTCSGTIRAAGRKKAWKDSMRLTRALQQQQGRSTSDDQSAMWSRGEDPTSVRTPMDLDAAVSSHLREGLSRAVDELQLLVSSGGKQLLPKSASVVDRKRFQVQRIAEELFSSCSGWHLDSVTQLGLDHRDLVVRVLQYCVAYKDLHVAQLLLASPSTGMFLCDSMEEEVELLLQLTAELMRLPCNSEGCAHKVRIFAAIQDPLMVKISSGSLLRGGAAQIALVSIVQEAVISNLKALEQQLLQHHLADGKAPEQQLIEIALSRTGRLSTRINSSIGHHHDNDDLFAELQRFGPVLSLINRCNALTVSSWRTIAAYTDTGEQQGAHVESLLPSPHYWTKLKECFRNSLRRRDSVSALLSLFFLLEANAPLDWSKIHQQLKTFLKVV